MQLTDQAQLVLKKIFAAYAGQPFEEGREERFRPENLCRAELKLAMSELCQAGILVVLQKMWGERLYYIPEDKLSALQSEFFPYKPCFENNQDVHILLEEGPGLSSELFRALLFVAHEGLPFTGKGTVHKKYITKLTSKLTLQDKHLRGLTVEYPNPEIYTLPAVIMIDLMLSLGLIRREGNTYILCAEELESWMNLPETTMSNLLFYVVMNRYGLSDPSSQHFRHFIIRPEFKLKEWISLSQILDWMESSNLVQSLQRAGLVAACLSWLECLAGCGWCQVGTNLTGDMCFRWVKMKPQYQDSRPVGLPLSPSSAKFIVQSDFEVLIPPDVPYAMRWRLANCTELVSMDSMWCYRLSREQLELAYERGMPPDEVISWLDEHTAGGLPEEVKLVLEQWGKDIGRTSFSEVLLLSCTEEADADSIAAHPRLQGLLIRLGPLSFSMSKEHEAHVRKVLTTAGLFPPRNVHGREEENEGVVPEIYRMSSGNSRDFTIPTTNLQQGLVTIKSPIRYLQAAPIEPLRPLIEEESIPSMWLRDFHRYHKTTAQKIMELALNWGTKVKISLEDQVCEFIPSRLLGNPWRISGYILPHIEGEELKERELTADNWSEIQLLIPRSTTFPPSVGAVGYVMINETTIQVDRHYT